MGGKILRRCDQCKGFHASYLVVNPQTGKKEILCQACWKKRYGKPATEAKSQEPEDRPPTQSLEK
jgi:hypothetical protein